MRTHIPALATGAALALAAPAHAQMGPMSPMGPGGTVPSQNQYQYLPNDHSLPQGFVKQVTALSYRTLELRAEDGGKLTPEHLASLQRELDQLKRQYHVTSSLRIRA
jgi:hypothetical protein